MAEVTLTRLLLDNFEETFLIHASKTVILHVIAIPI
jgi:hypothetical protein